jgi:hypothetical protein
MNLEHLLNNKKQINSAIIRQKSFQCSTFFQQILKESSQLNIFKNITITDRINFLLEKSNIEFCTKCSKPYFKCNQKHISYALIKRKKTLFTLNIVKIEIVT